MAFTISPYILSLFGFLMTALPPLVAQAEQAFDGKPGNGQRKKAIVTEAIKDMMAAQNIIKPDLLTDAQEAGVLETVDKTIDAVVSGFDTAKLFQSTPPTV